MGEFVEIAFSNGGSIDGYTLQFYNGGDGSLYKTVDLSDATVGESAGLTLAYINVPRIQNGGADGFALVDPAGTVLEFLSYEGTVVASGGAAVGLESVNVGVSETSSTPAGFSLQLGGMGCSKDDFSWQAAGPATKGSLNNGQVVICGVSCLQQMYGKREMLVGAFFLTLSHIPSFLLISFGSPNLQLRHLQLRHLQLRHLQLRYLQLRYLQLRHLQRYVIEDHIQLLPPFLNGSSHTIVSFSFYVNSHRLLVASLLHPAACALKKSRVMGLRRLL